MKIKLHNRNEIFEYLKTPEVKEYLAKHRIVEDGKNDSYDNLQATLLI
ncbi:MAG: hypothetical protein ACI93N_000278 [Flavobacteriaceae bacterium]|jgi:hypothetical protein